MNQRSSKFRYSSYVATLLLLTVVATTNFAQEGYKKPPKAVLDVLSAPVTPTVYLSPTRDNILLYTGTRYPPLSDLAEPMLRLAGLRINPRTNGPHRSAYGVALTLKRVSDGSEVKIDLPQGARIGTPQWTADGKQFAFTNTTASAIELWVGDATTGKVRMLKDIVLNATLGTSMQWMSDNRTLLVQIVPKKRGPAPTPSSVPQEPNMQESSGRAGPVRTFQDLLQTPHDGDLFEYYATSQLALVNSAGNVTEVGKPGMFQTVNPAPDGQHILVARIQRPFSYLFTAFAFPKEVEVWNREDKLVYKVASLPLADQVPIDGVATGPRNYRWRPTEPATLVWTEALDEGDPKKKVQHRDRVVMFRAPFSGSPAELIKTEHRFAGLTWGEKDGLALVSDFERDRRWIRTFMLNADKPGEAKLLWSRNTRDRYGDPGSPVMRILPNGERAIQQSGEWIFLTSTGASPEGDRPFLDRLNLQTLKTERLFRSDADSYESVTELLTADGRQFITRRETPSEPPNYYIRDSGDTATAHASGGTARPAAIIRALTQFQDTTPQLREIKEQLVKYNRQDGVQCSFTLYLPPGYKEGTRLPTVVWAYPLEYTDPDIAGQVTGSTQRFTQIGGSSHLFFLMAGYAILDNATMPVVGDPETVNNTYIEQTVMSAQAAIDKAVEMGVTDPERVGVGGHSYGAFMTANLLAHSDLFRAGIARSGAYNRTLTPFGFQSERRTLWEAPELYIRVSSFMFAHKIQEPILLIHGEADNNTGTFPIQSERMYQAIRGNGGTTRLVTLPLESHGYAARESIEHTLHEMLSWFDKHVKNAK